MALGEFTKQIAKEAILGAATKEPAPAAPQPENTGVAVLAQVGAMQKALKEDEELAVWCGVGPDRLRVVEIFVPNRQIVVLTGHDAERHLARIVCAAESLQLVCKVMKTAPGAKAARVGLIAPKA